MFERNASGSWTEAAKLVASDRSTGDVFGTVVALSGDRAIVGAPRDTTAYGMGAGSAYLYEGDASGSWTEVAKLIASDSETDAAFGSAVALAGGRGVVGASSAEWVYVYEFGAVSDIDDDGVANTNDNCPVDPNPFQEDVDGDLIGDACDEQDDGEAACGRPDIDVARDRGLYVWRSCRTDEIHVLGAGGDAGARFRGIIASDGPLSALSTVTLEDSDNATVSPTGRRIDFAMTMGGIWDDEFSFVAPKSACVDVYERSDSTGPLRRSIRTSGERSIRSGERSELHAARIGRKVRRTGNRSVHRIGPLRMAGVLRHLEGALYGGQRKRWAGAYRRQHRFGRSVFEPAGPVARVR